MNTHTLNQSIGYIKGSEEKKLKTLPTIPLYSRQGKKTNFVKIKQNGTTKTHEKNRRNKK